MGAAALPLVGAAPCGEIGPRPETLDAGPSGGSCVEAPMIRASCSLVRLGDALTWLGLRKGFDENDLARALREYLEYSYAE